MVKTFGVLSVRRLRADEGALYRDFMLGLDEATRHDRFCASVSDEFIARHVARALAGEALVFGCFGDGELRGVAELHLAGVTAQLWPVRRQAVAEAAFAVERGFQGRGIGTALLEAVVLAARNRGVTQLRVTCLAANAAMRRLAQKAQARLTLTLDEVAGEIIPPRPTPLSWLREASAEAADATIRLLRATGSRQAA